MVGLRDGTARLYLRAEKHHGMMLRFCINSTRITDDSLCSTWCWSSYVTSKLRSFVRVSSVTSQNLLSCDTCGTPCTAHRVRRVCDARCCTCAACIARRDRKMSSAPRAKPPAGLAPQISRAVAPHATRRTRCLASVIDMLMSTRACGARPYGFLIN